MQTEQQNTTEVIPGLPPIYDINKSYLENIAEGPVFHGNIPIRQWPRRKKMSDFLGYPIASPLGVPAGPLLSSTWTTLAARLGFDVVTYKTVRSRLHIGHPLPNAIFVNPETIHQNKVRKAPTIPLTMDDLSITNSFGNPSMPPLFLLEDIARARSALHVGQVLIVSVFGSANYSQDILEDFLRTASLAKEAGAHIIEANFSCPNVSRGEGCLYMDPIVSSRIASALAKAIHPTPLIVKLGLFKDENTLKQVLIGLAKANVRAICGINTISMKILNDTGGPALGQGREVGGVCGSAIRPAALAFVREARAIIDKEHLDLQLAACGGIVQAEHFDAFLEAGANVAMTATGMMWNPLIAHEWHNSQKHPSGN